ncbi:MAG: transporter [Prevotellaceae bacterium]|nr:transporter [Prevotellaceae bacterium]
MSLLHFLKEWTLPVAIVVGTVSYLTFDLVPALDDAGTWFGTLFDTLFPLCVFFTLFVTFAKVDFHKMQPRRWHLALALAQLLLIALCAGAVMLLQGNASHKLLAEAALTCIIGPCASAAPVVVGKIGGNIHTMTTYTLLSSLLCALTIPAVFPLLEKSPDLTFMQASLAIMQKLATVMLLPLLLGWIVRHYVRPLYRFIVAHPDLSFYCWALALAITTGITVKHIVHSSASPALLIAIALLSLAVCLTHFVIGRSIGNIYRERINCGQGMFQKNTAMAIWVAYMYLSPVASIGAGCYVLWQNIINSYEIWEHNYHSVAKRL